MVATAKEVVGFNIFNPSSYEGTGVGTGTSFYSEIQPGKNGKYSLTYDLGVSEESTQVPLKVPAKEKLRLLKDHALDASLLVLLDGEEIARFDLRKRP